MTGRYGQVLVGVFMAFFAACAAASDADKPRIEDVEFLSHGVKLSGSIAWPVGGAPRAAVVFVHGSGKQTRNLGLATKFAEAGIAALVYDKRGAGKSGGEYEGQQSVSGQNISLLTDDAVAALRALAERPALSGKSLGFAGISQAGWIAPLAAERSGTAKFLVLWSGPVCKVSEEDIYSIFTKDTDGPAVPTYQQALESRTDKYIWPDFLGVDTDPATSLRKLAIPGLWIFGGNDGSIPVDLSISRLKSLQQGGRRYEFVRVPGVGHNNMDQTFTLATDWIGKIAK